MVAEEGGWFFLKIVGKMKKGNPFLKKLIKFDHRILEYSSAARRVVFVRVWEVGGGTTVPLNQRA